MAEPDEDGGLARIKRDVSRIACGYRLNRKGHRTGVSKGEQMNIARTLCVDMGWPFKWEDKEEEGGGGY